MGRAFIWPSFCGRAAKAVATRVLWPLPLVLLTSSCSTVLHDESRFTLATQARQRYADSNVLNVVEADRKNLERLLAEEIRVVRDNHRLQVDFALLGIANNTTPMADTYNEALLRLKDLGFISPAALRNLLEASVRRRQVSSSLESYAKAFRDAGLAVPQCENFPAGVDTSGVADAMIRRRIETLVPRYKALCAKLTAQVLPTTGELQKAHEQWTAARLALETARSEERKTKAELAAAKKEFDDTVARSRKPGEQARESAAELKAKAEKLAELVAKARKLDSGLENDERIDALVELLTATAGGSVDPEQPAIKRAVTLLKEIPSLTEEMGDLESRRRATPASGLLLALRHQTSLAQTAKRRVSLAEERVTILKGIYDAYYDEAERWLRFTDGLCSYAVRAGGGMHPGASCNDFVIGPEPVCAMQGRPLADCVLEKPWKDRLRANDSPETKRELFKAMAAYLQALALQARPLEERFREIDVRHRETLLAKETALAAWNNLVGVPLDQLEAHYKAGIKPAELADLLVKALGLTAIAIGVAQ